MQIKISWKNGNILGVLNDSDTAKAIYEVLPFTSEANLWGQEVYFTTPIRAKLDKNPQQVVPPGTICFWVQGSALAIPFGPTPISEGNECRLVTAVNVIGKVNGDFKILSSINEGDMITVERAD